MDKTPGFSNQDPARSPAKDSVRTWTLVDELVVEVHSLSARFPPEEREGIGRSMREAAVKAAVSLMAVAGEGGAGHGEAVRDASRTLALLRYQIYLARRLNLMDLRRYRLLCLRYERAAQALKELSRPPTDFSRKMTLPDGS